MHVWHVTPTRNVFGILEEGLKPSVGERSQALGENTPRVYVFTDPMALEDALSNWLGEAFDEEVALSILLLEVAAERVVVPQDLFEAYIMETVAPSCIVSVTPEHEWRAPSALHSNATPLAGSPGL